ncbi:mitochondrial uncoupling protein 4 [Drosophila bipectinata]|uniref:mitochondrial uncoupling protein 4 n=1 Tax=Drosophila bipectinata TaxID=42026 RepID=UPI001C8AE6D4|nr:mitochondrial uncoupling protein 4 [Drosophila bipectinata]
MASQDNECPPPHEPSDVQVGRDMDYVSTFAPYRLPEENESLRLHYLVTNRKTPFVEMYITAFASACSAEVVGYPFDVCKTRMQIQGELASKAGVSQQARYRGLLATAQGIIKEEGVHKLYGGISAMILRHSFFTGIKMLIYDNIRERVIVAGKDGRPRLTFLGSSISGIAAGAGASIVTVPSDLIKIQMQMEGKRRLMGEPPRIHNVFQALTSIYQTGGIVGLWKGSVPSTWCAALVTLGDVSFYDLSKRSLMRMLDQPDSRGIQFLSAIIAGFAGAGLSTPADVIKSRIMNQPTDAWGRGLHYKGSLDCISKLVKQEGLMALYKGFIPYWLRVSPWSMVFWMTFEQIRRHRGVEGY